MTKLKSDFASLSLAIANLPVGLIPFPEVAKAALQQLNADVVHGVTSGTLDINAISADREAVAAALGGIGSVGVHACFGTSFLGSSKINSSCLLLFITHIPCAFVRWRFRFCSACSLGTARQACCCTEHRQQVLTGWVHLQGQRPLRTSSCSCNCHWRGRR